MASTTPIFYNTENICERKSSIICVFLHKYKGFKEASFRKVLDIIKTLLKERLKVYKTSAAKGMSSLSQVRQFFSEIYPMMVASQSGFDLRFLIAVLRPKALTRKQTQPFAEQLSDTHLTNLNDLYKAIYDDHKHGDVVYSLNKEALDVYDQFDEKICTRLNNQWQNGQFLQMKTAASEGGKERRLVLRLAVTLFVVYCYICRPLFHFYGPVPRIIPKQYMEYAIKLMTYFQQQRKEIDKVGIMSFILFFCPYIFISYSSRLGLGADLISGQFSSKTTLNET